ncbi:hypothetical protein D3C85_1505160 [compost metagenome]
MNRLLFFCLVFAAFCPVHQSQAQKMPGSALPPKISGEKASGISVPDVSMPTAAPVPHPDPPSPGWLNPEKPQGPDRGTQAPDKTCEEYFKKFGKKHPAC